MEEFPFPEHDTTAAPASLTEHETELFHEWQDASFVRTIGLASCLRSREAFWSPRVL